MCMIDCVEVSDMLVEIRGLVVKSPALWTTWYRVRIPVTIVASRGKK